MLAIMWTLPILLIGGFGCAPPPYDTSADTAPEIGDPSIQILFPTSEPDLIYCPVFTLVVDIDNLSIDADKVGGDHVEGEGHWHVYDNGEYISYETVAWTAMPALDEGLHQLKVDLARNDHQPYIVDGQTPEYIAEITVGDVDGCIGGGSPGAMDTGY